MYRKIRTTTKHFSSSAPALDGSVSAMSSQTIIISAPGSLMLLGEHAVLHGRRALCAAINRRVRVRLRARADRRVRIASALGTLETTLDRLTVRPPFTFVLAALRQQRRQLTHGLEIAIQSDFSHELGFGSSAAVTIALLRALQMMFAGQPASPAATLQAARAIIRRVQGVGSGADAAASLCGGIVLYRSQPGLMKALPVAPRLTAVYSGLKTPTADVIRYVEAGRQSNPRIFSRIFDLMDDCVARAVPLIQRQDWDQFGALLNIHHGLQAALGVNTPALEEICHRLRKSPGVAGAKISGSGLGDCAIGLGRAHGRLPPYPMYALTVDRCGVLEEQKWVA